MIDTLGHVPTGREQTLNKSYESERYRDISDTYRPQHVMSSHIDQRSLIGQSHEKQQKCENGQQKDGTSISDITMRGNRSSIDSENGKSKEHDSGYSSSATDASSNKSQSPKSSDREGLRGRELDNAHSSQIDSSLSFLHQTSLQFLQNVLSSPRPPQRGNSLEDVANPNRSTSRTIPPGTSSKAGSDGGQSDSETQPSYDWVMHRIRQLRQSSDKDLSTENTCESLRDSPDTNPDQSPLEVELSNFRRENKSTHSDDQSRSAFVNQRSSRPERRQPNTSVRSSSETREYTPRIHQGMIGRNRRDLFTNNDDLLIQEKSMHVHGPVTNTHDSNTQRDMQDTNHRNRPVRSEKLVRVRGNLALTKELDDAMRTLQIWGDRIQALSSLCKDSSKNEGIVDPAAKPLGNHSVDPRPHQDHQTPLQRKPDALLSREPGKEDNRLFIDESVSRSKGDVEANANNSANGMSSLLFIFLFLSF